MYVPLLQVAPVVRKIVPSLLSPVLQPQMETSAYTSPGTWKYSCARTCRGPRCFQFLQASASRRICSPPKKTTLCQGTARKIPCTLSLLLRQSVGIFFRSNKGNKVNHVFFWSHLCIHLLFKANFGTHIEVPDNR